MISLEKLNVSELLKLREAVRARIEYMSGKLAKELAALERLQPKAERRAKTKRVHALKGTRRPVKFRDPETGATWAGVGLPPRWLRAYEAQGKSRDEFATGKGGRVRKASRPRAKKAA